MVGCRVPRSAWMRGERPASGLHISRAGRALFRPRCCRDGLCRGSLNIIYECHHGDPMSNTDYAALNKRFAIPGQLDFAPGPGGLAVAEVNNVHASAMIALQGAHVMTWRRASSSRSSGCRRPRRSSPASRFAAACPCAGRGSGRTRPRPSFRSRLRALRDVGGGRDPGAARWPHRLVFRIVQDDATRAQWPHPTEP